MTDVPYDDSFYVSLARVIDEEPVQARDLQMLGMLLQLGIESAGHAGAFARGRRACARNKLCPQQA